MDVIEIEILVLLIVTATIEPLIRPHESDKIPNVRILPYLSCLPHLVILLPSKHHNMPTCINHV